MDRYEEISMVERNENFRRLGLVQQRLKQKTRIGHRHAELGLQSTPFTSTVDKAR
jgi:hypothetical protein